MGKYRSLLPVALDPQYRFDRAGDGLGGARIVAVLVLDERLLILGQDGSVRGASGGDGRVSS